MRERGNGAARSRRASSFHVQSYGNMGLAYAGLGNRQKALECLNKAIELDPEYEPAMINRIAVERLRDGEAMADQVFNEVDYYSEFKLPGRSYVRELAERLESTFEHRPKDALRHYEVGVRIGGLSLPLDFNGLLPWGHIDNRPFLRCLQGYGLCLWRLSRFDEAERVFERMLWLNPTDNQGARFLIGKVRAKMAWKDRQEGG
jgi:tetratricopeptide (TPR) repeat protein